MWRQVIHVKTHCLPAVVLPTRAPALAALPAESHGQRGGQDPLRAAHPRCGTRTGVVAGQLSGWFFSALGSCASI